MDSGIKLLGYIASALFLFMSIMLLLTMRQSGNMRGARPWLWSTVIAAFGIALNTSQESLPPFLSFVLGNTLIVVGAAVSALGTRDYRLHRPLPWQPLAGLAMAISLIIAFYVYIIPSNAIRALVVAVPTALICLWHVGLLLAGSPVWPGARGVVQRRFRLPHAIMALGLLMVAGVFVARGAETAILLARGITELPPSGAPQTVFLVYSAGLCGRLLLLIGMVVVIFDELNHDLRALASRDTLTGLFNRRGFTEAAASLASAPGSLLMLDLDRFKSINDDFGHEQGDRVIELLARCAQANLPPNALIARLGGEEFCALMPGADLDVARAHAESLREAFHRESAALGHSRQHTVSVGVASSSAPLSVLVPLMARADQALYQAKRDGRNRVAVASDIATA